MIKKIIAIIAILTLFVVTLQSSFALDTYVGIKILNLTDDPSASCAGLSTGDVDNPVTTDFDETAYDYRGRIRALSSILPGFPIYFNLSLVSDGSTIWEGDSTEDIDYEIGDTIFLPQLIDIQTGVDYNLFLDIDAIRIYLPLESYHSGEYNWDPTIDDNYWTAGKLGSGGTGTNYEIYHHSVVVNTCAYSGASYTYGGRHDTFFSNDRSANLISSCTTDLIDGNCDDIGLSSLYKYWGPTDDNEFKTNDKYNNLYTDSVGNINLVFTGP